MNDKRATIRIKHGDAPRLGRHLPTYPEAPRAPPPGVGSRAQAQLPQPATPRSWPARRHAGPPSAAHPTPRASSGMRCVRGRGWHTGGAPRAPPADAQRHPRGSRGGRRWEASSGRWTDASPGAPSRGRALRVCTSKSTARRAGRSGARPYSQGPAVNGERPTSGGGVGAAGALGER